MHKNMFLTVDMGNVLAEMLKLFKMKLFVYRETYCERKIFTKDHVNVWVYPLVGLVMELN